MSERLTERLQLRRAIAQAKRTRDAATVLELRAELASSYWPRDAHERARPTIARLTDYTLEREASWDDVAIDLPPADRARRTWKAVS